MSQPSKKQTSQEIFWSGEFGDNYIERNQGDQLLASNLNFFNTALGGCENLNSCVEFGANIGMNLRAMKLLFPNIQCSGIEINKQAASQLKKLIGDDSVFNGSISDFNPASKADLALIKGVLIHISPTQLREAYEKLHQASKRYILIAEYYNPSPVSIDYRGHSDKLFKRDFAGEILDIYHDLRLVDYGFAYHRDDKYPQDDITWFLLEKR
ncbi:pseudaminic acid biosynthesis-associated methylase [Litorivicinus sp.]|nr:pseudaminic acid biosynthesis-associated methylase [Litorivicinus sp.]